MKKLTIITGAQGSGKTTKARELARGRRSYESDNLKDALLMNPNPEQTDVIIIDGMSTNKSNIDLIKNFLSNYRTKFRKPYSDETISFVTPKLIWCSQLPIDKNQFDKRDVEFIEL